MIYLIQNTEIYNNDIRVMLQAFYPSHKIINHDSLARTPDLLDTAKQEVFMTFAFRCDETGIDMKVYDGFVPEEIPGDTIDRRDIPETVSGAVSEVGNEQNQNIRSSAFMACDYTDREAVRNPMKLKMYGMLTELAGRELPWGTLTGVRPTKIAMAMVEQGMTDEEIVARYRDEYSADSHKAQMCVDIARRERRLIDQVMSRGDRPYCLYVGIPFCPTRCLYCSFTSYPIGVYKDKVGEYLDAMDKEMAVTAEHYRDRKLVSIYVGGGTPSSISADDMDRLCTMIEKHFDTASVMEYTVEAGRPDSTTADKLKVLKSHGVTRISINPQTMNDETLKTIGRAHTADQTVEAFRQARLAGFDNINMDLIVGLPGEDAGLVENTLKQVEELAPESLTVHTLAIKRAANLKARMDEYKDSLKTDVDTQLKLVNECAARMGLNPYYLYRQKNMAGNLENVGYAAEGLECLYNILIMEEITDIVGIGAGSSCKLIKKNPEGSEKPFRIERTENVKNVDEYISRIDEMIDRKRDSYVNNENKDYYRDDLEDAIKHGVCVSILASRLARAVGLDDETVNKIAMAGMLHDIGKMKITPYINGRKEDSMRIEEMRYVRLHARLGSDILVKQGYDKEITDMVLYHHENYDGSGYPFRMSGEAIPIGSRIIRICDVFTALVSDRSYRKAFDAETAMRMVIDEVRHFDMKIFLVFMELVNTTDVVREIQDIIHSKNNYDKAWSEIM